MVIFSMTKACFLILSQDDAKCVKVSPLVVFSVYVQRMYVCSLRLEKFIQFAKDIK